MATSVRGASRHIPFVDSCGCEIVQRRQVNSLNTVLLRVLSVKFVFSISLFPPSTVH